jgi:hypothetical protein
MISQNDVSWCKAQNKKYPKHVKKSFASLRSRSLLTMQAVWRRRRMSGSSRSLTDCHPSSGTWAIESSTGCLNCLWGSLQIWRARLHWSSIQRSTDRNTRHRPISKFRLNRFSSVTFSRNNWTRLFWNGILTAHQLCLSLLHKSGSRENWLTIR